MTYPWGALEIEEQTLNIYQTTSMPDAIPKNRSRVVASLAVLCLSASFTQLMSEPVLPAWWEDRGVTNTNSIKNMGVANLGQLKHVAIQAHSELEGLFPNGAGYFQSFVIPEQPDAAWYVDQKKALNLGQLKNVAKPFYDQLNSIDSNWVKDQLILSGLAILGTDYYKDSVTDYYYPWDPDPAFPVSENYKAATVGQIKLVYSLRTRSSSDGDAASDLMEKVVFGDTDEVIDDVYDANNNGTVDFPELRDGYGLVDTASSTYLKLVVHSQLR